MKYQARYLPGTARRRMRHYLNVCNVDGDEIAPYQIAVTRARFMEVTP